MIRLLVPPAFFRVTTVFRNNGGTFPVHRGYIRGAETLGRATFGLGSAKETSIDTNTLLIILIVLLVLGGGGLYGRGRWF